MAVARGIATTVLMTLPLAALMKQRQDFIKSPITDNGGQGEPANAGSLQRTKQHEKDILTSLARDPAHVVNRILITPDLLYLISQRRHWSS